MGKAEEGQGLKGGFHGCETAAGIRRVSKALTAAMPKTSPELSKMSVAVSLGLKGTAAATAASPLAAALAMPAKAWPCGAAAPLPIAFPSVAAPPS